MRNKLMLNSDGKPSEAREQMTFFSYVNMKAAQDEKYKMIFAVANGGSRHKLEAINLKRQGVLAGVPDIIVDVPTSKYHGLRIELKVGKNKPTDKQKEFIERYNKMGYKAVVCCGAEQAIKTLEDYFNESNKKDRMQELLEFNQKIQQGVTELDSEEKSKIINKVYEFFSQGYKVLKENGIELLHDKRMFEKYDTVAVKIDKNYHITIIYKETETETKTAVFNLLQEQELLEKYTTAYCGTVYNMALNPQDKKGE